MQIGSRVEEPSSQAAASFSLMLVAGSGRSASLQVALPFPAGLCSDVSQLRLINSNDEDVAPDLRVRARWPDGSLQWVSATWYSEDGESAYRVHVDPSAVPATQGQIGFGDEFGSLLEEKSYDANANSEDRGPIQVDEVELAIQAASVDGSSLSLSGLRHENLFEGKHHREMVFHGELLDRSGTCRVAFDAQVTSFISTFTQRWRITLRNPSKASHPGGIWELGDPNAALLSSLKFILRRADGESADAEQERRVYSKLDPAGDWSGPCQQWQLLQLGSGGEHWSHPIHRDRSGSVSVPMRGYRLVKDDATPEGTRATPSLVMEASNSRALGMSVPKFWQTFPRGLAVEDESIVLAAYPEESGYPMELQPGEQARIEFSVASGTTQEVKERLDWSTEEAIVRVDPQWVSRCGVIPWLTPRPEAGDLYLRLVDQAVSGDSSFFAKREQSDEYGWRHFGEVYGDHEAVFSNEPVVSHYNNQYDVVLGLGLNFLRGGDPRWLELMKDLARHVIDIDIYHTDEDLPCYNNGMFWHTTHYVDAGIATHRSYPRGTCGGGPSSGHAYARGLYLYYCTTGDQTAREAVEKMGDWMIAAEDGTATKYRWFASGETGLTSASGTETYHGPGRGPGNAVEVLVTAFELTHERRYLDQAERLIRRVVHPDQDIAALDLLDGENKWFYLMFLQALGRYLEVKVVLDEIDTMYAYGKRTLLRYADWMAEHERLFLDEPEKLEFPTETWAAQDMRKVEVFQWAARHADSDRRKRYLERAGFFYGKSLKQLNDFDTKSLCRPIALLLTNGYSHQFFRSGGLGGIPAAPQAPEADLPRQQHFLSQKSRAIRNVKLIAVTGGILIALLGILAAGVWLSRA